MALARKYQIIPGQAGFHHCYTRCVRRAFLCGHDTKTGKEFSHRRRWIVRRIEKLAELFSVDVYAFAVMQNHLHLVLHVDPQRAQRWPEEEVVKRWRSANAWRRKNQISIQEKIEKEKIAVWRERLGEISWFMKSLNEPLARWANAEDECTGHFWEGRYKSKSLLDERGVVAAMAYVDINPIRAGECSSLITSNFTSIQHRLRYPRPSSQHALAPVFCNEDEAKNRLDITVKDYLSLVDHGAESSVSGGINNSKKAFSDAVIAGLELRRWSAAVSHFDRLFTRAAGSLDAIRRFIRDTGRRRLIDVAGSRLLYPPTKTRT